MSKTRDKLKDRYCQDCKNYKRPCCYVNKDPKYTARKKTCEWFKLK